jgi:hypothetical protein
MQLRSIAAMYASEMKAALEKHQGLALCLIVRLIFADERFDLRGNQAADRSFPSSSQNFRLTNSFPIEADRDVQFHCVVRGSRKTQDCQERVLAGG